MSILSLSVGSETDGSRTWSKTETGLYLEQGLPGGAALVIAPALESRTDAPLGFNALAGGTSTLGLRLRLGEGERWAAAAQASLLEGRPPDPFSQTLATRGYGAELRLLGGRSFAPGLYGTLELAFRRWDNDVGEARLEGTLGIPLSFGDRPAGSLLLQAFSEVPLADDGTPGTGQIRLQTSWLLPVTESVSLQAGLRTTVAGGVWRDRSAVVGLWRRW